MGVSHRMCQNQCSWFGRAVRRRITDGTTLRDLRRILVEEWNTIPQIRVQRLIMSMRRRCQDVIAAHGGSTQARSYGGRGGAQPPWKNLSPPLGCSVPFAVTIGIEVYPPPPPGILSAPPANDTWLRRWFYRLLVYECVQ